MPPDLDSLTSVSLLGRLGRNPMDQEAWNVFVDRYGPKIYGWCRRWGLQEADAQDVTQAVLTRLAVQMGRFNYDPTKSFRGWLRTLSHHAWYDFLADRGVADVGTGSSEVVKLLHTQASRDDLAARLEEDFDRELLEEATRRIRRRVTPQTWEAYRLTAIEGLSGAEASERLGMKLTAVFMAKSNVLKHLREEVRALEGIPV